MSLTPFVPHIVPPQRQACDALMTVFIVVVAIVVTAVTWGAASGAMTTAVNGLAASSTAATGTIVSTGLATTTVGAAAGSASLTVGGAMLAGAAAGAAGAAASGAIGSMAGVSSFSWRNVAAGAISGALTAGLANKLGSIKEVLSATNPDYLRAAGLAVANAGASYAGQKLAGVNTSFSWRSIATSAVSSVASARIAPWAVGKLGIESDFGNDFVTGLAGGMVSAAVRSSFGQTLHGTDYLTIAADAFGNALANASARSRQARPAGGVTPGGMSETTAGAWDRTSLSGTQGYTPAMGAVNSEFTTAETVSFGDQQRRTAITVDSTTVHQVGVFEKGATNFAPIVVTGNYAHDSWYMSLWDWSNKYHMPPPPTTGSYAGLVRYSDEATRALAPTYNAYLKRVYQGQTVSVGSGISSAEFERQWRTTGVNGLLGKLAEPFVEARAWADHVLAPIEQGLQSWGSFNRDLSANAGDYASSAWGAGGYATVGAFNASVTDLLTGGVGLLRMGTNTERLVSVAGGVENLLSTRPSEIAARAVDSWNGMTLLEKQQGALTGLMGFGLSASRLSRLGAVDRSISTAYGEMLAADTVANGEALSNVGIRWGRGIQGQGMPWEDYLATQLPGGSRLPPNFKTFDFYDLESGAAISAKTLDTSTASRLADPRRVFNSLRGNIDSVVGFDKPYELSGYVLDPAAIASRELRAAVPASTNSAQWQQIANAIKYGQSKGVTVVVTPVH